MGYMVTVRTKRIQYNDVNALTSVCEVDHSPLWTMTLGEDKMLTEFKKHKVDVPRQKTCCLLPNKWIDIHPKNRIWT